MQGDFREDNFDTAMQVLRDAGDLAKGDLKGRKGGTRGNLELRWGELTCELYFQSAFFENVTFSVGALRKDLDSKL